MHAPNTLQLLYQSKTSRFISQFQHSTPLSGLVDRILSRRHFLENAFTRLAVKKCGEPIASRTVTHENSAPPNRGAIEQVTGATLVGYD
jgi:hypothetical protein